MLHSYTFTCMFLIRLELYIHVFHFFSSQFISLINTGVNKLSVNTSHKEMATSISNSVHIRAQFCLGILTSIIKYSIFVTENA